MSIKLHMSALSILWMITASRESESKSIKKLTKEAIQDLKGPAKDIANCLVGKYKGKDEEIKDAAASLIKRYEEWMTTPEPEYKRSTRTHNSRMDTWDDSNWTEADRKMQNHYAD